MQYTGRVIDGVVVFDDGNTPPEGTPVRVVPAELPSTGEPSKKETLGERLLKFAGTVKGLPLDMAEQHDHYVHGQPKR